MLDQEVTIDLLLKDHGLSSAMEIRSMIGEECDDVDKQESRSLFATAGSGLPSIKVLQLLVRSFAVDRTLHSSKYQFAVHPSTRQTHKPTANEWEVVKRVAR